MPRPITLAHTTRTNITDASVGLSGNPLDQMKAEFLIRATLSSRAKAIPCELVSITRIAAPADDADEKQSLATVDREFERRIFRLRFDA